jgi:hypothetical protein
MENIVDAVGNLSEYGESKLSISNKGARAIKRG